MARIAVIDLETTGFGRTDRVVEVSIVVADSDSMEVVEEFDTLINPQRDVGPTNIHGVTASMVEAAPTFEDVSAVIADLLDESVLVAHNLSFDQRFLLSEFDRSGGKLNPGRGQCTLRLSGERLEVACQRLGIPLDNHHRALADARATWALFQALGDATCGEPALVVETPQGGRAFTLRREAIGGLGTAPPTRRNGIRYPSSNGPALSYLATLDFYLDDLILSASENSDLRILANELGITETERAKLHDDYLATFTAAAMRDGIITQGENSLLTSLACALGMDASRVPDVTTTATPPTQLDGMRVCFTGTAIHNGQHLSREDMEAIAAIRGLQPVSNVTKRGCDLLVAADTSTSSSKAKKARSFGIPVLSIQEFMAQFGELPKEESHLT